MAYFDDTDATVKIMLGARIEVSSLGVRLQSCFHISVGLRVNGLCMVCELMIPSGFSTAQIWIEERDLP